MIQNNISILDKEADSLIDNIKRRSRKHWSLYHIWKLTIKI